MNLFLQLKPISVFIDSYKLIESISFQLSKSICLLGASGSGKSTLLKKLFQEKCYETNGKVEFCFYEEKNISNWKEEILYASLDSSLKNFCDLFFKNQKNIVNKCLIIKKILLQPNYLFCEDFHFTSMELKLLLDFLRQKGIFLFYVTNDIESTLFFDYLIVLKNKCIAIEGKTDLVLKEEKVMKVLGFSLPFVVNLSTQLKYYGLLNSICYSKEEMERELWKKN